jgi:hypothetical protein
MILGQVHFTLGKQQIARAVEHGERHVPEENGHDRENAPPRYDREIQSIGAIFRAPVNSASVHNGQLVTFSHPACSDAAAQQQYLNADYHSLMSDVQLPIVAWHHPPAQ